MGFEVDAVWTESLHVTGMQETFLFSPNVSILSKMVPCIKYANQLLCEKTVGQERRHVVQLQSTVLTDSPDQVLFGGRNGLSRWAVPLEEG